MLQYDMNNNDKDLIKDENIGSQKITEKTETQN